MRQLLRNTLVPSTFAALLSTACGPDTPTSPVIDAERAAAAGAVGSNDLVLRSVQLSSRILQIEGFSTFVATIENATGMMETGIALQAWVRQGRSLRAAGGALLVGCGPAFGDLTTGTCVTPGGIAPSNLGAGEGTLRAGRALALIELRRPSGEVFDVVRVPIVLVE